LDSVRKPEAREQAAEYLAQGVTQPVAALGAGVDLSTITRWTKDPDFMQLVTAGKARVAGELAPRCASILMDAANVVSKYFNSSAVDTTAADDKRMAHAMKLVEAGLMPAWLAKVKVEADARRD